MPKSRIRSINESPEMLKISGNAVGQVSLEVRPDPLIGIKLRRISGEVNGMDSRISFQESLGKFGFVERAAVPEKEERTSDLAAEVPEKPSDLLAPNVSVGIKAGVEAEAFSLGRDRDGGDGRDFSPASGDHERWCFSFNRPGSLEIGDERESALIQEYQAGSKLSGLFLYEAKLAAPSNGWIAPGVPWLFSAASDNSIQGCSSDTKDLRGNSLSGSSSKRLCRYVSRSRDPLSNRLPEVLLPGYASESPSAVSTEEDAAPDGLGASVQKARLSDNPVANALRNLKKLPVSRPRCGRYGLASKDARPCVAVVRVFSGCHEVS